MAGTITTKEGMNGPLGTVRSIDGPDAMELLRLITLQQALRFNMNTGMNVTRMFSMKLVKQVTGLRTNDKKKQDDKLTDMITEQRKLVTYVETK